MTHRYQVCGVALESEIALPELMPGMAVPDVRISVGPVAPTLATATIRGLLYVADADQCVVTMPGVARFLIQGGSRIVVDPVPDAPPQAVRLFLLGAALGFVLSQRGLLVWHASSAVAPDGRAVVLAGHSGRGKSTVLASMLRSGFRMLSDDLAVLTQGADGAVMVQAAFPKLKLRRDALRRLGLDVSTFVRIRPEVEKFVLPVERHFVGDAVRLRAVYVLDYRSADGVQIAPISGSHRLAAIRPYLFSVRYAEHVGIHRRQFPVFAKAVSQVPVRTLSRPPDEPLDRVVRALASDLSV